MKKIAFALVALLVALSPLAAGESWVGVTTGPAFEIQVTDDLTDVGATDTMSQTSTGTSTSRAHTISMRPRQSVSEPGLVSASTTDPHSSSRMKLSWVLPLNLVLV